MRKDTPDLLGFVAMGAALGALFAVLMLAAAAPAQAQDMTTLLSTFLAQLRNSHLLPGGGGTVPVVSACGDGALQTGSNDTVGRVIGTTQTACTITFGGSYGGNSADCVMENLTANRGNITAASSTAFTVSNLTAGDDFMYVCLGR